jgi:zinc transporter ZupT
MSLELIWLGCIASLAEGLATGAKLYPYFAQKISDRLLNVMLGFSSGIMLAATSFTSRESFNYTSGYIYKIRFTTRGSYYSRTVVAP